MKGYDEIGEYGQKLFDSIHNRHLAAMSAETRQHYTRENVKRVKANNVEGCIEVYFKNGEWFKYYPNGTWG